MKPHKWAKEIKAWADGAEIESRFEDNVRGWLDWGDMGEGLVFSEDDWWEYRIKPQPKEQQYLYVYKDYGELCLLEDKIVSPAKGITYIGKIKLETDDGQ